MRPKKVLVSHIDRRPFQSTLKHDVSLQYLQGEESRYPQVLDQISEYDALIAVELAVDENLLAKAQNLKIVSNYGVGYDNVDVISAKARGCVVSNTPRSTARPTAVFAISLILSLLRKVTLTDRQIRTGKIKSFSDPNVLGTSPEGKILGIVGMGRIGKELAMIASSMGMSVIYHNRNRVDKEFETAYRCRYVDLDQLAKQADVVSLHVPFTSATDQLIDAHFIRKMKSTAFIVNTARGGVMDYDALGMALEESRIAGAALDVFPNEPQIPKVFIELDNVILTPHNGTGTMEARTQMFDEALQNVINFFSGAEFNRVV